MNMTKSIVVVCAVVVGVVANADTKTTTYRDAQERVMGTKTVK